MDPKVHVSDAARNLLLGMPVGGSVLVALLWTAGVVVVFAPLAMLAYRRG